MVGEGIYIIRLYAYLHLNIENANALLLRHVPHRLGAGTIVIPAELGPLYKAAFVDEGLEAIACCEVVFTPVLFAGAGGSGCICHSKRGLIIIASGGLRKRKGGWIANWWN